jgi:hypothetical protein
MKYFVLGWAYNKPFLEALGSRSFDSLEAAEAFKATVSPLWHPFIVQEVKHDHMVTEVTVS